jgi:restriction endonuclease S subunit
MDVREPSPHYVVGQAGYQKTDGGLIPVDWQYTRLTEVARLESGHTPSRRRPSYWTGDIPWVSLHDVEALDANEIAQTAQTISAEGLKNSSARLLPRGTVVFSRTATVGKASVIGREMATSQDFANYICGPDVHNYFLVYLFRYMAPEWKKLMAGSIHNTVYMPAFRSLRVVLPPRSEQQAIAEALSDVDALIESLSLLLAKKRQMKQGAMQELLNCKKRLPGFCGDWVARRLDQLADIRSGGTPSTAQDQFWNGDVLWCTPTDITALEGKKYLHDTARKLTVLGMRASAAELIPATSVVMTTRATIGECAINATPVTTNQGFKSFVPFDGVDVEFLYYLLQKQRAGFISLCSGSTFLEIGKAHLSAYEVIVPQSKDEQYAISSVLSEIDRNIDALQAKLGKVKALKQGMMQSLLTGHIRLVQPAPNVIPLPIRSTAPIPAPSQFVHNWQINEAVVIGILAQHFGSEKMPLGRKRRVKLMYLLHRHAEGRADGYLKKVSGPYDPNTKYKGPEAIALKNGYVQARRNDTYEGFVAGDKIEQAKNYFEHWYGTAALEWLEQFHYRKTNDLELLATVDMAIVDLAADGHQADVPSVKRVITAHPEWVAKLSRELFSDDNIASAIAECQALLRS